MRATLTCTACSMAVTRCACSLSNHIRQDGLQIAEMLRMSAYAHSADWPNMNEIKVQDAKSSVLRCSQAVHNQHS